MRHTRTIATAAVLLATALMAGACTAPATAPSPTPSTPSQGTSRTVAPGISEWADGTSEAAGWVTWVELEGGFWALQDRAPDAAGAKQPRIVAVLLPGSVSEKAITALRGTFVVAHGRLQGGASIRMAGPELIVDRVTPARPAGN